MTDKPEAGDTSKQYLEMSDEDFLNINSPVDGDAVDEEAEAANASGSDESSADQPVVASGEVVDDQPSDSDQPAAGDIAAAVVDPAGSSDQPASQPASADPAPEVKADAKTGDKPDAGKTEPVKDEQKPVDYEGFFKQVMAPFKANGRTIELRTPEEAIRLMQMGAGYGRKIQDLQPHLKVLRMLEKNDLMDVDRLSFLIDVNQKNPDAIKKIIKDSGIDPLDLNMEDNTTYTPKNHAVSDKEMAFFDVLKEVQSNPTGETTITTINQTWDQESKKVLWESPELLTVIQSQRENGIYDQIVAEIDRQKLLGHIPANTPFLQAYKTAGDFLTANNGFKIPANPTQTEQPASQPQVIATRTAAPKAQVQNGDKAAAAASPKTIPAHKAATTVNPLEMADDDFLKTFQGRI